MEPVISALKEHYAEDVAIIVADLDNPQTQMFFTEYDVLYIPAFFFINAAGEVVASESGVLSFESMSALVELIKGAEAPPAAVGGFERFISETIPGVVAERSLLALALVLFGGLITSISPCILSMVPLLVGYIGGYSGGTRFRGFSLSLAFISGMAFTFAILGFIAATFGRIFGQVGLFWYYLLAAVAIIMGLQLLGALTFNLPGLQKLPVQKVGHGGSLGMGLLFGLVASPCATPVLAVIITYAALQGEPLYGSFLLFLYGLGHGLPLLVAGTFTGMAKSLPEFSRYTRYISSISGLVLVLAGLYLLLWIGRL